MELRAIRGSNNVDIDGRSWQMGGLELLEAFTNLCVMSRSEYSEGHGSHHTHTIVSNSKLIIESEVNNIHATPISLHKTMAVNKALGSHCRGALSANCHKLCQVESR